MFGGDSKIEKAIYTLAFTILISAVIFSGSMVFSASLIAGSGVNIGGPPTGNAIAPPGPPATTGGTVNMAALVDDDPFKGDANAPVILVEFSDFQCPFCRRHYTQTLSQIETEYIDTGKLKYVFRDFPLSFHPAAQPAGEASECADDQGKFWEFHDKIFDEQNKQGQGTIQFSVDDIKRWAGEIGLNTQQFNECLDSGKHRSEVQKDFADGGAVGISGTPGFYIGKADGTGTKLVGAQPFATFKAAIDAALAG